MEERVIVFQEVLRCEDLRRWIYFEGVVLAAKNEGNVEMKERWTDISIVNAE